MAPAKKHTPLEGGENPGAAAAEAKRAAAIASLREYSASNAIAQLFYIVLRTLWHVGVPTMFGARPFVPLVLELLAAEVLLFLLFSVGGGFGAHEKERRWMLTLYNLLSVGVLGKCATDAYVYYYSPAMWQHFQPGQLWGVPTLLAARMGSPPFGLQPAQLVSTLRFIEVSTDAFFLLNIFKGVRAGKGLVLAHKEQKKAAQRKKVE